MTDDLQNPRHEESGAFCVAALYHFASFARFESVREPLDTLCKAQGVRGTLLLAHEGINGTIAGTDTGIATVLAYLRAQPEFASLEHKESRASKMPFVRMKVKLKKEIVTMGVEDIDPNKIVGTYVDPKDWNALISDPDTIVIDTRNDYETAIGIFRGAVDPNTKTFREFPDWVKNNPGLHNKPKIAMYCTGGIRCEKATAFMKQQGFEEVYHLKGGILKYLENVPEEESLWDGACFVFDERVSVTHGLKEGDHQLCHACRNPITPEELTSPYYEAGVSCSHCYETRTEEDRDRYRQRQKQIALAKQRGERHIGS
ncbi:rhodanese-related sulfurtransferase [Agrobacterium vitis]|uniref:oxygen-dependent tRNA uridine(34) hydroxylase TrhO n=1 Tax=Agrobacterium vitis TaxID=373 RepID=UPI0008731C01|nr:rhodanese-related sulfurtransferase [Agrobacterium vitis]MCE6077288.1 rhodanese-related sulfurtransferase [Agrobacterium vitis]MCM2470694.1 rhodanese-related sulfurtransferase [Agrobacterium vitis]MUO71049.1 rhodanese-related sulfurtransferase [Agrobacterium vitis]MUO85899.1 rhodanese-related sulfurtransferase [Agrobacterium vitis]